MQTPAEGGRLSDESLGYAFIQVLPACVSGANTPFGRKVLDVEMQTPAGGGRLSVESLSPIANSLAPRKRTAAAVDVAVNSILEMKKPALSGPWTHLPHHRG